MSNIVVVIHRNEDGGTTVARMTKVEFLAKLKEDCWGESPYFAPAGTVPDHDDDFVGLIIVEGDVVVPRPVQIVTEFTL